MVVKCTNCNDTGIVIENVYDHICSQGEFNGIKTAEFEHQPCVNCQEPEKDITKESKVIKTLLVTGRKNH